MHNTKYNHLILGLANKLSETFFTELSKQSGDIGKIDTSPLLNVTVSVFISSLINNLHFIKKTTIGEIKLMENIDLMEKTILNAIKDLPFVTAVEEH